MKIFSFIIPLLLFSSALGGIINFSMGENTSPVSYHPPQADSEIQTSAQSRGIEWSDTFEDSSRVSHSQGVRIGNWEVTLLALTIPNDSFEMGTLGDVPTNWDQNNYNMGPGAHFHEAHTVDTHYYEGSRSLYGYSKVAATSQQQSRQSVTYVNMSSFVDATGLSGITIYMRDVQRFHSGGWGWNDGIKVVYTDGVNSVNRGWDGGATTLFCTGENAPETNFFNSTIPGADSTTWKVYNRKIPSDIDRSHVKLGICWFSSSWSSGTMYNYISSTIDKITFDMPPLGYLISEQITIPQLSYANILQVDKTTPSGTSITVTVLNGSDNTPIPGYLDLVNSTIDLTDINPLIYPTLKLKAQLSASGDQTPILNEWSLDFISDTPPVNDNFKLSTSSVYRTDTISINYSFFDPEEEVSDLITTISYRTPIDTIWQTTYFSNQGYLNDNWTIDFTPPLVAPLGFYDVNISCTDMLGITVYNEFHLAIKVYNNFPQTHDLDINTNEIPKEGTIIISVNGSDVEDIESNLDCSIQAKSPTGNWTSLPSEYISGSHIAPGEEFWRATFTPGREGERGLYSFRAQMTDLDMNTSKWFYLNDSLYVLNSAPDVILEPVIVTMYEDIPDCDSIDLLSIFEDVDGDNLTFFTDGQEHLEVETFDENGTVILRPKLNWYGTEEILFTASDSQLENSILITIEVLPMNDPPKLEAVQGVVASLKPPPMHLNAHEDHYLNFTLIGSDIDGDALTFGSNLTDGVGGDDDSKMSLVENTGAFSYLPEQEDVGTIHIEFWVLDTSFLQDTSLAVITIHNTNDPPEITIIEPTRFEFYENETLNFSAIVTDIDEPWETQSFTITWSSNISSVIGVGEFLEGISLPVGSHMVTTIVEDGHGGAAQDNITITVMAVPVQEVSEPPIEEEPDEQKSNEGTYWWLYLIIIVILICIAMVFILFKIKSEKQKVLSSLPLARTSAPAISSTTSQPSNVGVTTGYQSPITPVYQQTAPQQHKHVQQMQTLATSPPLMQTPEPPQQIPSAQINVLEPHRETTTTSIPSRQPSPDQTELDYF